jgi:hypothetical protein
MPRSPQPQSDYIQSERRDRLPVLLDRTPLPDRTELVDRCRQRLANERSDSTHLCSARSNRGGSRSTTADCSSRSNGFDRPSSANRSSS